MQGAAIAFQLIVLTFLLLLPSNRQLNRLILVSFHSAMTTKLVFAELLCCDCECVFCNSLVFYVSTFYFILWAVVSVGYPAWLSCSYFERLNDDDDDDTTRPGALTVVNTIKKYTLEYFNSRRILTILYSGPGDASPNWPFPSILGGNPDPYRVDTPKRYLERFIRFCGTHGCD